MAEVVQHTRHRLSAFVNVFPHIAFSANYLVMKMVTINQHLTKVIYAASRKKVDLYAISSLLKTNQFDDIDEASAHSRPAQSPEPNRLKLEFSGHIVDQTTKVYRVDPFRYWSNLTGTPTLMEYVGEKFLIYNRTINCVKAIDEPPRNFVSDKCETSNGLDKRLSNWQRVITTDNPYEQPTFTSIKSSVPYTYIYCFRLNITINGETTRCPPYVFRVNYKLGWNSTDLVHKKIEARDIDATLELTPMTHEVHSVHFVNEDHLTDENLAIDKIRQLSKKLQELQRESVAFSLPNNTGVSNRSALLFMSASCVGLLLIVSCLSILKHRKDTKRHHKVMRTVTDGIYGDGTYDVVKPSRRAGSVNTTMPAQVNVTLHGPPASIPPPPPRN